MSSLGIGSQSNDQGSQKEVPGPVEDSVLAENTVVDLGGGAVDWINTICRLEDLSMKPLQKEHPETGLDSIFRSIYDPY